MIYKFNATAVIKGFQGFIKTAAELINPSCNAIVHCRAGFLFYLPSRPCKLFTWHICAPDGTMFDEKGYFQGTISVCTDANKNDILSGVIVGDFSPILRTPVDCFDIGGRGEKYIRSGRERLGMMHRSVEG
jgi:hypothetical protein